MPLLDIPSSWTTKYAPAPGVAVVTWPPRPDALFASNLVLTTDEVDAPDLRTWQRDVDLVLAGSLTDYHLIDLQLVDVAGSPGVRRVISHATGARAVTVEQWAVLVRGVGFTVSATSATLEFATEGAVLRRVARTLTPLGSRR